MSLLTLFNSCNNNIIFYSFEVCNNITSHIYLQHLVLKIIWSELYKNNFSIFTILFVE